MKKSKISILLACSTIMLAATSLTSCGNEYFVENAGEALEIKTIEDLKNNSSKDKPIVVRFWHSFGGTITEQLDPLIDEFEEKMQEQGIYIEVKSLSTGGGYDGLRQRVNSNVAVNKLPTMVLGYPDHFADYINSGILLPLDDFVKDENIGMVGKDDYDDIYENYKTENYLDIDGDGDTEIAGIPFNKSTECMYYNCSAVDPILEEKGYLDADGNWSEPTWEQVWDVSQTLRDKIAAGTLKWGENNAYQPKKTDYPVYIDSESNFFITTARQWCNTEEEAKQVYTTSTSVSSGQVRFNNATTKAAQNYFYQKAQNGLWNIPPKVSQSYGSKVMQNLEAFISIGSTAGVKNNSSAKYDLKVTTVPQRSYDGTSVNAVIQQGTNAAILSKNSNNLTRLSAWLLIKYLTSTEVTTRFSKQTGYMPVRKSAVESEEYQNFLALADNDADKTSLDYVRYGTVAKAINAATIENKYFFTDPAFKGSSIIRDKLTTLIKSIYVTGLTIDEAYETVYNGLKKDGFECI